MSARSVSLIIVVLCLAVAGCGETPERSAGSGGRGAVYYASMCGKCHGMDGEGVGKSFPPLAGSEWVNGNDETLIRIVLYGLQGEIEVRGETYRGLMVGFERQLSDEHVAEILTYVRSSWGNAAEPVDPSTVARIRQSPNPGRPLRAEELQRP